MPLKRIERAKVLYNSKDLEEAHMASAVKGDSVAPSAEEPVGFHFITFTKGNDGHLWEVGAICRFVFLSCCFTLLMLEQLEGSWDPIDRGALDESEDMLSARAIELGVGRFVKMAEGNIEFSIVALATRPGD